MIFQELKDFLDDPPSNIRILDVKNLRTWTVELMGATDTLYTNEKFRLRVIFPPEYPLKPPIVYFLQPTPKHTHIYTNGDICLNLLGNDWRPSLTAKNIFVAILSMLSSATEKRLPVDNAMCE